MDKVIGIDLGTSFSCVSVVIDGNPVVIPDKDGTLTMQGNRSCIQFEPEHGEFVNVRTGYKVELEAA